MRNQCQRVYTGKRLPNGVAIVHVIGADGESRLLKLHYSKCNHSPTGFEWGYAGSGPAQLAFEILFDVFDDAELALDLHQRFKFARIVRLPREGPWRISESEVVRWASQECIED